MEIGEFVQPGTTLGTFIELNPIWEARQEIPYNLNGISKNHSLQTNNLGQNSENRNNNVKLEPQHQMGMSMRFPGPPEHDYLRFNRTGGVYDTLWVEISLLISSEFRKCHFVTNVS